MKSREEANLEKIRHGVWLLDEHAEQAGPVAQCPARRELDRLIASIEHLAVEQARLKELGPVQTLQLPLLEEELRGHIGRIVVIAVRDKIKFAVLQDWVVPPPTMVGVELIADAAGKRDVAAKRRAEFVEEGLRDDFVESFTAAIEAYFTMNMESQLTPISLSKTTRAIPDQINAAWPQVRAILALIEDRCGKDSRLLSEFRSATIHASRLDRLPAVKRLAPPKPEAGAVPELPSGAVPPERQLPAPPGEGRSRILSVVARLLGSDTSPPKE